MGTFGVGSFDNDEALDWVWELEKAGMKSIADAFAAVESASGLDLEAPDCCNAIAAAEVVAALRGQPGKELRDDVRKWVEGRPAPDETLVARARKAVAKISEDSELSALWQESDDEAGWRAVIADLRKRLA